MVALTIGMATYNDFDGVYFTVQALRLYQDLDDTELLVVDNAGCDHTRRFVEGLPGARYLLAPEVKGTAAPRDLIFREARGAAVLCCDGHVLFAPGAIARLKAYYRQHPETIDLLQGPLLYDDGQSIATHFEPVWREQMWGIWATDPRGRDPEGEPFEIPMQGLGAFSCRKDAWPGFNPAFRGFGGEEGYLHEKIRQRGGRCLCLPWLRWMHRFGRPAGAPYQLTVADKLRNYVIGHAELGLDLEPVTSHFAAHLPEKTIRTIARDALFEQEVASLPLVSCICATYNRPPDHQYLLEEAIESFLRQSYPNKELIVVNDCPGQELVCDAPGVQMVNVAERFANLGEKRNFAVSLARGDLLAEWDDDDISLPWRLSLSVETLAEADYFNPKRFWFMNGGVLHRKPAWNCGHNLSLFRRAAFEGAGGYPPINRELDAAMEKALRASAICCGGPESGQETLAPDNLFYIYRWGVSPHHFSGSTAPDYWEQIGELPIAAGRFTLRPHWRRDYGLEARQLANGTVAGQRLGQDQHGNEEAARDDVRLFVAGQHRKLPKGARRFPLMERGPTEAAARHLDRVMRAVDEAVIDGGTHLLVPRDAAGWLQGHPLLTDYFAAHHDLIEASPDLGLVFDLQRS